MMNKVVNESKFLANDSKQPLGKPTITEYSIRVRQNKNKHHVMRFNYNLNIDFSKWRTVR